MNDPLLIRFLSHRCSPEELQQIDLFLCENEEYAKKLFELEQLWSLKKEIQFSEPQYIDQAYIRFLDSIDGIEKTKKKRKLTRKKQVLISTVLSLAAAIFILFFLSIKLYQTIPAPSVAFNVVEVPVGQRVHLTLSDGTKVWLNAESKLTYPSQFSSENRVVNLEGEGYFEVAHNPETPFIVETSPVELNVLGTIFTIRAYPEEEVTVTLSEGKVELFSKGLSLCTLNPKEQAVYSIDKKSIHLKKNIDTQAYHGWMNGEFVFTKQSLKTIAHAMKHQFGVEIIITDAELAADLFTCRAAAGANLENILDLLQATRRLTYKIKEKKVIISKPTAYVKDII